MSGPAPRSPRAIGATLTRILRAHRPRDLAASLELGRAFAASAKEVRSILAVKPHDQLGDFLVAVPALRALRAHFPKAEITLVTRPYVEPLARRVDAIDRVIVVPRVDSAPGLARAIALANAVRGLRPDVALVLNSVSRSRTADAFAALSGARLVVGRSAVGAGPLADSAAVAASPLEAARHESIYDLDLPIARASTHQVERVCDLLAWLADPVAGVVSSCGEAPRLDLCANEREGGRAELAAISPSPGRTIGIHPAAANPLKCWPVESFVEWGARIVAAEPGARLVVLDTPKDPGPARAVHAGLRARGVAAALLTARPLDALVGPLAALDLLACNDSGMMHLAAALGVATLSCHSLGAPEEWAPKGGRARSLHANPIDGITVAAAIEAASALLGSRQATR